MRIGDMGYGVSDVEANGVRWVNKMTIEKEKEKKKLIRK